ncbi:MAG TPA: acyltransferase [Chloroflexota bacterium]
MAISTASVPLGTPSTATRTSERLLYLDNLKVILVAGVIVGHAVITYGGLGSWIYLEQSHRSLIMTPLSVLMEIGWLFAVGLFFFVSGLLTPASLEHKGSGRFVRDRLIRLGVPLAAFVLVVMPIVRYAVYLATLPGTANPEPYWAFLHHQDWIMNLGPMWFVLFLLMFSISYAIYRNSHPRKTSYTAPLRVRQLIVLAASIAAGSAVLRLIWPFDPRQALNLHVGLWVQYPVMFWFGALCAERGWLAMLPGHLWRRLGVIAVLAAVAVAMLLMITGALSAQATSNVDGWPWPDLALAGIEGVLAVSASLWSLEYFRRRHSHQKTLGAQLSRSSYGAFVLQTPIIVGTALSLRSLGIPPEAKMLIVALIGLTLSFGLSWLAVTRLTLMSKIL